MGFIDDKVNPLRHRVHAFEEISHFLMEKLNAAHKVKQEGNTIVMYFSEPVDAEKAMEAFDIFTERIKQI